MRSNSRVRSASPKRTTSWSMSRYPGILPNYGASGPNLPPNFPNQSVQLMKNLENEYIRSLQQQIYLLELENKYIRQQTANALDLQPAMINEASSATSTIKELNAKIDSLELELYRKEAHVDILQQKHDHLDAKLKENLFNTHKDTDEIKRQLVTLRGEREIAIRENMQKDQQLQSLRDDLARHKSSLAAADVQLDLLRAKLEHETAHVSDLEKALIEKRTEMLQMNATLRQLELQFRQELTRMDLGMNTEIQEKMERLQRQLTDCYLNSENDRYLRDKQMEDVALLTQENARLNKEFIHMKNEAEQVRCAFERLERRHTQELAELNTLRQREKDLLFANGKLRQELDTEQKKYEQLLTQPKRLPYPTNLVVQGSEAERLQHSSPDPMHCGVQKQDKMYGSTSTTPGQTQSQTNPPYPTNLPMQGPEVGRAQYDNFGPMQQRNTTQEELQRRQNQTQHSNVLGSVQTTPQSNLSRTGSKEQLYPSPRQTNTLLMSPRADDMSRLQQDNANLKGYFQQMHQEIVRQGEQLDRLEQTQRQQQRQTITGSIAASPHPPSISPGLISRSVTPTPMFLETTFMEPNTHVSSTSGPKKKVHIITEDPIKANYKQRGLYAA
ncbi:hypothetical protein P879_05789 [Paragonimus westermani]|uniref:t-SNARE coiled-coil homology domain-containing protein n=1 Tax=Paragonimus westermani TaxID=34504 RepID=A0A8T0DTH8_9TREM|nr:hypothetical protein P879_05789 [Paragonimus westermani]